MEYLPTLPGEPEAAAQPTTLWDQHCRASAREQLDTKRRGVQGALEDGSEGTLGRGAGAAMDASRAAPRPEGVGVGLGTVITRAVKPPS